MMEMLVAMLMIIISGIISDQRGEQACGKATMGQKALQQRPHVSLQASSFFLPTKCNQEK